MIKHASWTERALHSLARLAGIREYPATHTWK